MVAVHPSGWVWGLVESDGSNPPTWREKYDASFYSDGDDGGQHMGFDYGMWEPTPNDTPLNTDAISTLYLPAVGNFSEGQWEGSWFFYDVTVDNDTMILGYNDWDGSVVKATFADGKYTEVAPDFEPAMQGTMHYNLNQNVHDGRRLS